MCDYSLHAVDSRPARVGDELITTKFDNTLTRGFCAIGEPNVAVCLFPGTELAFTEDAEVEHPFARLMPRFAFGKLGEKVARFRQIDPEDRATHHDALEFPSGKLVLVTRLRTGQLARVLQLPTQSQSTLVATADERNQRERVS